MTAIGWDLATYVERQMLARNDVCEAFFGRESVRLADACREMSERFLNGGRLLAFGRGPYGTDAQHVSVEFVHPVIVGKRALPALDVSVDFSAWLDTGLKAEDIVMGFGPPEGDLEVWAALTTARRRGAMTLALPGAEGSYAVTTPTDDPFVHQELVEILYHTLWETVHVFLEHRELGHDAGEAGFLYPFLGRQKQDVSRCVDDAAASIRMKVGDDSLLRERVAREQPAEIARAAVEIHSRLERGGKLILFGNGGSATDANDWMLDCIRPPAGYRPIPAVSLALEPANFSAIANDVGVEVTFLRQLIAHARPDDVAVAFSTSGGSRNIVAALEEARKRGLLTVALLGMRRRRNRPARPGRLPPRRPLPLHPQDPGDPRVHLPRDARHPGADTPCLTKSSSSAAPVANTRRPCASGSSGAESSSSSTTWTPTRGRVSACGRSAAGSGSCRCSSRTTSSRRLDGRDAAAWSALGTDVADACSVRVRGVVQGVGFRPFVSRLARRNDLTGWVLNGGEGVDIHLEGAADSLSSFLRDLELTRPPSAVITAIEIGSATPEGLDEFVIRESLPSAAPTVHIAPDLPVCDDCLRELFDAGDPRFGYPYINCTNCGPRYSVVLALPYDRPNTTMREWPLDEACAHEYADQENRRFHAQPVACPECGPGYFLRIGEELVAGSRSSIGRAVEVIRAGGILAIKGIGGYHLACDARNRLTLAALRTRKYRKEKPFALMVKDMEAARALVHLTPAGEELLTSAARPIVIAPARVALPGAAPGSGELGVMLPYSPVHHLLFAHGAPDVLVMTSANRSSEPMAYEDHDAIERLAGIADGFLIGQRAIARRVDDSVVRDGAHGPAMLRRSRGYAPGVVATLPIERPLLAVGPDLKNTITLVVAGQAIVSQHIGDLGHHDARVAFERTIDDMIAMYRVSWSDVLLVHDSHPEYVSTIIAQMLPAAEVCSVQHHRAHIASVLAERQAWSQRVIGVSLDGTGYGDDGSIWGGELFAGSLENGFDRVAHLRPAALVGGDRAARHPVQAAAGFLAQVEGLPDLLSDPFRFPDTYRLARLLLGKDLRIFTTTSMGRLFDAAAALLGFTRETTFEGQAAIWAEHLATKARGVEPYPFPFAGGELDFRPLLHAVAVDRHRLREPTEVARAFHLGLAQGLCDAILTLCEEHDTDTVVCSGGVWQNELLCATVQARLASARLRVWSNSRVPCNDGGISLGQAALASFDRAGRGQATGKGGS